MPKKIQNATGLNETEIGSVGIQPNRDNSIRLHEGSIFK